MENIIAGLPDEFQPVPINNITTVVTPGVAYAIQSTIDPNNPLSVMLTSNNIGNGPAIVNGPGAGSDAHAQWYFQQVGPSNICQIVSASASNMCLTVQYAQDSNGAQLIGYAPTGGLNETWTLVSFEDGTYGILTCMSNPLMVTVSGGNNAPGTQLVISAYTGNPSPSYCWRIVPAPL